MESQAWNSSASGNGRNVGVTLIAGEEGERRGSECPAGVLPQNSPLRGFGMARIFKPARRMAPALRHSMVANGSAVIVEKAQAMRCTAAHQAD
jgi:hypothetical protein